MTALAVIAGGGELPRAIAERAQEQGRSVFVVALDQAGEWVQRFANDRSSMGLVGRTLRLLRSHGCREAVFAGYVARPNFFRLRYDLKGLSWFFPVLWAMRKGDNTLLDAMVRLFEHEGIAIRSIRDVAPWLQVPPGLLGTVHPASGDDADIALAIRVARAQGARDVGQAVVVRNGQVLAVEDKQGTDAMLSALPRGSGGVLAKALKPIQDGRTDLPTIGIATVENAAAAGLAGIVIEANTALVLGREGVAKAADTHGLFVLAVPPP